MMLSPAHAQKQTRHNGFMGIADKELALCYEGSGISTEVSNKTMEGNELICLNEEDRLHNCT